MSNSLGVIRSSAPLNATRQMQPKMFLNNEKTKELSKTITIVEEKSKNIVIPINKTFLTFFNILNSLLYIGSSTTIFLYGNLNLKAPIYNDWSKSDISFDITWFVALYFAMAGFFSLTSVTFIRNYYFESLGYCISPWRWFEYFILSGLMTFLVSYLAEIRSLLLLISLSLLITTTSLFGLWTEMISRPSSLEVWSKPLRIRILPFLFCIIPSSFTMITLLTYFYISENYDVLHLNVCIIFAAVMFPQFVTVLTFQQCYTPRQYQTVEVLYLSLSLVTRLVIGGLVFSYILIKDEWNDQFLSS